MNVSQFQDANTANTNPSSAIQRAENLAALNVQSVIELCVGPSLSVLEQAYKTFNISVTGNDIEDRWRKFYPNGKWIIGDALKLDTSAFDAVVFAPPLSKGCSGRREDSLSIDEVVPKYIDFLNNLKSDKVVLVLPGRTLSTRTDRKQYYKLLSNIVSLGFNCETIPLTAGRRSIVKYVDLYLTR